MAKTQNRGESILDKSITFKDIDLSTTPSKDPIVSTDKIVLLDSEDLTDVKTAPLSILDNYIGIKFTRKSVTENITAIWNFTQQGIQILANLTVPNTGYVGFAAKADGLYQKIGATNDLRLLTTADGLTYAPISTSSNYIQNQNASAQLATIYISGKIKTNDKFEGDLLGGVTGHASLDLPLTGGTLSGDITTKNITATGYTVTGGGTSTQWNTAYNDRNKWDGGSTGLVAATGRVSLSLQYVTNESKATMFTNPTFTGTVTTNSINISTGNTINWLAGAMELNSSDGLWWQKIHTVDSADKSVHRFLFSETQGNSTYVELFGVDGYGDIYAGNRKVYHTGNFNPDTKANLASPTFTGTVTAQGLQINGSATFSTSSTDRVIICENTSNTNANSPKLSFWGVKNLITGPSIQKIGYGGYGAGRLAIFQHIGSDYTNETEVFSILPNGYVGINEIAPTTALDVSGVITSTGLQVNGSANVTGTVASAVIATKEARLSSTYSANISQYQKTDGSYQLDLYGLRGILNINNVGLITSVNNGTSANWQSAYTHSISPHSSIVVTDNRGADRQPSYYLNKTVSAFFNESITGATGWKSGINVKGWENDVYNTWQLFGGSNTITGGEWYFREGLSIFGGVKRIWHSDNLNNTSSPFTASTITATGLTVNGSSFTNINLTRTTSDGSAIQFNNSDGFLGNIGFLGTAYKSFQIGTGNNYTGNLLKIEPNGDATFSGSITASGAINANLGSSTNNPLNLTSAGTLTTLGSRNSSWFHLQTAASSGFYFYNPISILGQAVVVGNDIRLGDDRYPSNNNNLVHISESETITGLKTFSSVATITGHGVVSGGAGDTDVSLNLQNVSGGSSSIIFSSGSNKTSDKGFIRFFDSTTDGVTTTTGENNALVIGVENDGASDRVIIQGGWVELRNKIAAPVASYIVKFINGTTQVGYINTSGSLNLNGSVTATSFNKTGGTSAQFLKADGGVDSNVYALTSALSSYAPTSDYAHLSGTETFSGAKTFNQPISTSATSSRDHIRVWSSATYTIGMQTSFTFGGLVSDYAMTFQMNSANTRGFWWGDEAHGQSSGAMALTTHGLLTLARGLRLGYGENDAIVPTENLLDIKGGLKSSDGTNGCTMQYNGISKTMDFIFN